MWLLKFLIWRKKTNKNSDKYIYKKNSERENVHLWRRQSGKPGPWAHFLHERLEALGGHSAAAKFSQNWESGGPSFWKLCLLFCRPQPRAGSTLRWAGEQPAPEGVLQSSPTHSSPACIPGAVTGLLQASGKKDARSTCKTGPLLATHSYWPNSTAAGNFLGHISVIYALVCFLGPFTSIWPSFKSGLCFLINPRACVTSGTPTCGWGLSCVLAC